MPNTNYNRLKDEASNYLKQHKNNPVHWWAYGPEALQKAKDENKPIFLSIGYSSCHWCHVMADESFENEETANFLNKNFIAIKVDREEYPDIDQYYQQACQLFTQGGGWPLSAFLLPDMRPYFVGTYFPPKPLKNMTSFMELLIELKRAYTENNALVTENAQKAFESMKLDNLPKEKVEFSGHFPPPAAILDAIKNYQDQKNGGFGEAPKFPQFSFYEWAVEQILEGFVEKEQAEFIIDTLEQMLMGGLVDQVRGGIHRYSVDEKWLVPHFEKMLYDQAGLIKLLAKAGLLYQSPLLFDTLINSLDYLESEMLGDQNVFFSAQDSDSEGVEGLYHTFSEEEFETAINNANLDESFSQFSMDQFKNWFQISKEGNFDNGLNIISLNKEIKDEIFTTKVWEAIREIKKALMNERKLRVPPATDNKGVASWNFMMVSALIDVMQYSKIDVIKNKAVAIFNKLLEGLYGSFLIAKDEGGFKIRHTTTRPNSLPYFEDYTFFAESQLRVYEITGNPTFKENFETTLRYIIKEFIEEDKILTRSISASDHQLYPNLEVSTFDQSFKSPKATFIHLLRKGTILFNDQEMTANLDTLVEKLTQDCLKNPISSGEALRALTYPDQAYKLLKVPSSWVQKEQFISILPYFMPRFILDYHRDENESWQICSSQKCELQGETLEEFIKIIIPNENESEENHE